MFDNVLKKFFGSKNEREIKRIMPIVDKVNKYEEVIKELSNSELKAKTSEFKQRIENGETLDSILTEAFALVREASVRTLGMRHFDVQLIGGIFLHEGKITEMKTGEGKTLVATLPVYLNALTGKGVHIVTVNDYLAKRDAEWMGEIYKFLGLSVGVIVNGLNDEERKIAYDSDITYGTNNEFGFDYLRDNMKYDINDYVQREFYYSIVDEVDSILIDEARTPLIISGAAEESTDKYFKIDKIVPKLSKDIHFTIDEKTKNAVLTDEGVSKVEELLKIKNLFDPKQMEILHHVNQALRAHRLFKRDVDYVVKDGEVIIVDEFTGRLMPGRRWSDGLHQAIEAKENVKIENENQTLATITLQNYFRMYEKLAGMTGTADTEAAEFKKIYNLDVMLIPTNMPMIREDYPDVIYKTVKEKFKAVMDEIKELNKKGQPVLVGTISIEKSELLSNMLKKEGITHNVLNAKHHEKEAEIVALAGRKGVVTISTNMAGRGTDILLGGKPEIVAMKMIKGEFTQEKYEEAIKKAREICEIEKKEVIGLKGLRILGTERHESRRIDNQLRGRTGRQGDPGSTRFYLSLEDDLLRIFGSDKIKSMMERLGMEEGQPLEHSFLSKAIENAQKQVEGHNFEIRKHLLEYDDVMNKQREVIYEMRKEVLKKDDIKDTIVDLIDEISENIAYTYINEETNPEEWDMQGLKDAVNNQFGFNLDTSNLNISNSTKPEEAKEIIFNQAGHFYSLKEETITSQVLRHMEKVIFLNAIDHHWKDHLLLIDHLKEGIGLRGYGQKDPLKEYQKEAYKMFLDLTDRIKSEVVERLFKMQVKHEADVEAIDIKPQKQIFLSHGTETAANNPSLESKSKKVGRNEPCPCGSGKKYKKCCGLKA